MTPKEKADQQETWTARNIHVLEIQYEARSIVSDLIAKRTPKADIFLLAELIIDIVKRFD